MGRREPSGVHLGLSLPVDLHVAERIDERHTNHHGSIGEFGEVCGVVIVGGSILGGADETVTHAETAGGRLVKTKAGAHRRR